VAWHKSLKRGVIPAGTPLSLDEALLGGFVDHYNNVRLNSARFKAKPLANWY